MPLHAVLLAHGPSSVTRQSLERLRRLPVDAITIVAPHRHAHRGLRRHASPVVTVVETTGQAGVREALDHHDGTTLLLHDDLLLTADCLATLLDAHEAEGGLVAPWSNDPDQVGHVGDLPRARRAEAAVRAAARRATGAPTGPVRATCVLGSSAGLWAVTHPLVADPSFRVDVADVRIRVVDGAVVAHDASCTQQLPPPTGLDGHPLVVAAMIVRDEEAALGPCLEAVAALADRVVVCDTGSTDATITIAREAGATVLEREWRDDFGWARNQALDAVGPAGWILHVDADERLEVADPRRLRQQLAAHVEADAVGFTVEVVDAHDASSFRAPRLFPASFRYAGALHEVPVHPDGDPVRWVRLDGLRIVHGGYDASVVEAKDKVARNVAAAETAHDAEPSAATALALARALAAAGEAPARQLELLRAVLDADDLTVVARADAHAHLADLALQAGDTETARAEAAAALAAAPDHDRAGALHARAAAALGRFTDVLDQAAQRHATPPAGAPTSPRHRATETAWCAVAALGTGDEDGAADMLAELLRDGRHLDAAAWAAAVQVAAHVHGADLEPVRSAAPDEALPHVLEAVVRAHPPSVAGRFAAALVHDGHPATRAVEVALLCAVVLDDADLAASVAAEAERLPAEVHARLVERALELGHDAVAAELEAGVLFAL